MTVSIQDVARLAGVSSATVSRVLAGKPHVREEVRERVLYAVAEMNYQPSRVARSLRVRSSLILGLIISDIQNPFFTALVRAVEDLANANKYALFLCNSDEDVNKEALYIDLMLAEHVAGVILTPTREMNNPCRKLVEAGVPVVAVDRRVKDLSVDTVILDNAGGARDLITHVIDLGHRRIGAIFASSQITTGRERYQGYKSALAKNGIRLDPGLVRSGLPNQELGYRFTRELLEQQDRPTALFAGNNLLTIGALRAIQDMGLRIPEDISLVAFDDMDWASLIRPGLTVVAQPTYEMGRTAADLVLKRIAQSNRPVGTVELKPSLCLRESVADIATNHKKAS
jgi:DNA-binding LacI/PurR family transcriptional regulator